MARKLIIDTDPGIDDCMAILLALRSPELEVVGLTTVFGNTTGEKTALNALRILETVGAGHIPVARGCDVPLVVPISRLGTHVHGEDGLGNTNPPLPKGKWLDIPAAQFIVDTVLANPGEITLAPIGPLTNIALALRLEPRIAELVSEVVIMGGAATVPGNASPVAEANIWHDPHAASIVFGAGWKLTMVGLDVTTRVIQKRTYLEELCSAGNQATNLLKEILPCYQRYFDENYGYGGNIHTHDPSVIAYLIDPRLFRTESWPIFVETEGHCAGQTVPDYRHVWGQLPCVNVCLGVDAPGVLELIKTRLMR
ncbi:MAG: nucleoside hydrolase [Anaerolineae bacterium]|nr:nucleoside hydrolase [Anaerolineae bacterium]